MASSSEKLLNQDPLHWIFYACSSLHEKTGETIKGLIYIELD